MHSRTAPRERVGEEAEAGRMDVHCSMMGAYEDSRALRSTSRRRRVSCHVGSAMTMGRTGTAPRGARGRGKGESRTIHERESRRLDARCPKRVGHSRKDLRSSWLPEARTSSLATGRLRPHIVEPDSHLPQSIRRSLSSCRSQWVVYFSRYVSAIPLCCYRALTRPQVIILGDSGCVVSSNGRAITLSL